MGVGVVAFPFLGRDLRGGPVPHPLPLQEDERRSHGAAKAEMLLEKAAGFPSMPPGGTCLLSLFYGT